MPRGPARWATGTSTAANSYQTAQYEDGIMATTMDGGTTLNSVSVGIEEIKVLTSAMPAEYGHATAGALIVVKKAGTNTFHGEGGELFKSTSMMHRTFFQRTTLQQDNPDNHTLFQMPDFVVSGPVIIPKLYNGKNKTFFQVGGSYHIDSSSNAGSYTTPTPAMLAGDFSAYSNQIYDPASTSGSFAAGNLSRTPVPRQHHSHEPVQHDVECHRGQQAVPGSPGRHRQHHQYRPQRKHRGIGHGQLL